jgi:hypothetical protein
MGGRGYEWELKQDAGGLQGMSIDKESDGVPEVDLSKRTTKVNLSVIVAVGLFLGLGALMMWWLAERGGP